MQECKKVVPNVFFPGELPSISWEKLEYIFQMQWTFSARKAKMFFAVPFSTFFLLFTLVLLNLYTIYTYVGMYRRPYSINKIVFRVKIQLFWLSPIMLNWQGVTDKFFMTRLEKVLSWSSLDPTLTALLQKLDFWEDIE